MTSLSVILVLCVTIILSATSHPAHTELKVKVNDLGIIGGHNVTIEKARFIAAVLTNNLSNKIHICGASIIHKQFVLLAAHCCVGYAELEIVVGSVEYLKGGKTYTAANITVHEKYQPDLHDYDICIIKLNDTLKFNAKVGKITLADNRVKLGVGTVFTALGWGDTEEDNPRSGSKSLLEVQIPFVPVNKCQEATYYYISPRMICAGAANNTVYYGDSGGPLTLNNTILAGITSFGLKPFKGVTAFVKVTSLLPWINKTITKHLH